MPDVTGIPAPSRGARRDAGDGEKRRQKTARAGLSLSLKGRALRLLSQREHSRAELETKLGPHEETSGELARVLDDLQAKDFISEARVVESVINRRSARFGSARIRRELIDKDLDPERISDAVRRLRETELERARAVWKRKFDPRGEGIPSDASARARQMRFLAARGFSGDVIGRVIRGGDDTRLA